MTYKTHFLGGICAVAMVNTVVPMDNVLLTAAVGGFAALVPDMDKAESKIGNKLGALSEMIESTFGHRGFIHTPILYVVLFLLMGSLPSFISIGFLVGALSHLVLDTFNRTGIMWLFPLTKKKFSLASVKTRSGAETMFCVGMLAVSTFMVFNYFGTMSYEMPTFSNSLNITTMLENKFSMDWLPNLESVIDNLSNTLKETVSTTDMLSWSDVGDKISSLKSYF